MKKTLVALAVLGSFAGVASAATSVTLYGVVDAGYEDWSFKKDLKSAGVNQGGPLVNKLTQGGYSERNSRIGFKGQEDLGNGLAAIFKLEGSIGADTGETNLFDKESTVGLKGSFGEVKFGRAKSQMELALGGVVPGARVADLDLYSVAHTRHSNGLFYSYDNAGFSFGADVTTKGGALGNLEVDNSVSPAVITGEGSPDSKVGYGIRAGWTGNVGGNVTLLARLAHQNDGIKYNGKTARETGGLLAVVVPYSNNALTVGVAYAQGKGGASDLVHAKFGDDDVIERIGTDKAQTLSAVVASTFGPNDSAYVKYQERKGKTNGVVDYKGNVWAIGYAHSLSKRTSVYADVARATIKNTGGQDGKGTATGYSVGLAHNF